MNICLPKVLQDPINKDINNLKDPDLLTKIILDIEPDIETITSNKFQTTNKEEQDDFNSKYNKVLNILLILDKYFENHEQKDLFNVHKLNINSLRPAELLSSSNESTLEYVLLLEHILVLMYLSNFQEHFLDTIGKLDDDTIEYYLDVIDTYVNINNMNNDNDSFYNKSIKETETLNKFVSELNKSTLDNNSNNEESDENSHISEIAEDNSIDDIKDINNNKSHDNNIANTEKEVDINNKCINKKLNVDSLIPKSKTSKISNLSNISNISKDDSEDNINEYDDNIHNNLIPVIKSNAASKVKKKVTIIVTNNIIEKEGSVNNKDHSKDNIYNENSEITNDINLLSNKKSSVNFNFNSNSITNINSNIHSANLNKEKEEKAIINKKNTIKRHQTMYKPDINESFNMDSNIENNENNENNDGNSKYNSKRSLSKLLNLDSNHTTKNLLMRKSTNLKNLAGLKRDRNASIMDSSK